MPQFEREEEDKEEFDQWWIFSYGDLVTLLLVFFILLYSFCKPDVEKFESVAESFKPVPPGSPFFLEGDPSVLEQLVQQIEASELSEEVIVTSDREGVRVTFRASALFESGSATLTAEAEQRLRTFVSFLFGLPNPVVVEGHSDDQPIGTGRFPSNWELSGARAGAVTRFFEAQGVSGERMKVVGYADTRPRVRNVTDQQRALNRRVDVLITPQTR